MKLAFMTLLDIKYTLTANSKVDQISDSLRGNSCSLKTCDGVCKFKFSQVNITQFPNKPSFTFHMISSIQFLSCYLF